MQSNPEKYKSLLPATATIIKEEGAASLVKGLGPTLVGYGIEGALKFGVYEITKPLVVVAFMKLNNASGGEAGMFPFLIASILAGAVASLILVPMESTRIRMVTDPEFEGVGLIGGLSKLVEEAGLAQTLSLGMGAMLAKQVSFSTTRVHLISTLFLIRNHDKKMKHDYGCKIPYTFGKQVSFDVVAKFLYRILNSPTSDSATLSELLSKSLSPECLKWAVSVLSAMVASVMACFLSHPGDVILTETHKGGGHGTIDKKSKGGYTDAKSKHSLRETSATIYSRNGDKGVLNGLSGFFTGLQARFVHVGLIITSQLVIYDIVKQLLGLPATGSH